MYCPVDEAIRVHIDPGESSVVAALGNIHGWESEGYMVKFNPLAEEVPKGKARGTPEGKGLYLSVYPESSPNTDNISF